jgi:hypothetical protein
MEDTNEAMMRIHEMYSSLLDHFPIEEVVVGQAPHRCDAYGLRDVSAQPYASQWTSTIGV